MTTNCCIVLHAHSLFYLPAGREGLIAYLHSRTGVSTSHTSEVVTNVQRRGFTIPRLRAAMCEPHMPRCPNSEHLERDLIGWFAHELRPHDDVLPTLQRWQTHGSPVVIIASHPTGALITMLPHTESSTVEAGQEASVVSHCVARYGQQMPVLYVDASPLRLDALRGQRYQPPPITCHVDRPDCLYGQERASYEHHRTVDLHGVDQARTRLLETRRRRAHPVTTAIAAP